jgi:hypothetical protein
MNGKNVHNGSLPPAIADSIQTFIANSPGAVLLSAALLGFLLGRVFSRS